MSQESSRYSLMIRFFAAAGAAGIMFLLFSPKDSDFRVAGALLLIGWIPVLMHLAEVLVASLRRRRESGKSNKAAFEGMGPFVAQAQLEVQLADAPEFPFHLVRSSDRTVDGIIAKGKEGFTVRLQVPEGIKANSANSLLVPIQFKSEELARAKLRRNQELALIIGKSKNFRVILLSN